MISTTDSLKFSLQTSHSTMATKRRSRRSRRKRKKADPHTNMDNELLSDTESKLDSKNIINIQDSGDSEKESDSISGHKVNPIIIDLPKTKKQTRSKSARRPKSKTKSTKTKRKSTPIVLDDDSDGEIDDTPIHSNNSSILPIIPIINS